MLNRIVILLLLCTPFTVHSQAWTLDSCIRYSMEHNLALQINEQNIQLAHLYEITAWGGVLPSLNAQAGHGYNWGQRIDPFTNEFASNRIQSNNFGISTSITLFSGLQQYHSIKQAELNTAASLADYEKAKNDMALNIALSYLNILLNKEYVQITQQTRDATQQQVERIEKLVSAGQLAASNLSDIQAQYATDQANWVSAQNNFQLSKLSLMQLLTLDLRQADRFEIVYPEISMEANASMLQSPQAAIQSALSHFPEIRSAQLKLASSEMGKKIAAGGYSPSINASYSYGTGYSGAALVATGTPSLVSMPLGTVVGTGQQVVSFPQLMYGADDYTVKPFNEQLKDNINQSLFFTLTIPLFNGFNNRASNQRAKINVRNATLQLEQSKQQLEQSIYKAHADALAALANYQSSQSSVEASQKSFDWIKTKYEQGAANSVEFNDARTRLQNALATQTRNKYEYIFKLKVLEFYEGKTIRLN